MVEQPVSAVDRAIELAGTATALANACGLTKSAVSQWKRIPAEHCPTIERLTDRKLTCEEMRPDVDWAVVRSSSEEISQ